MRHPAALLALVLTSASLTAVATASTPTGSTVTLPRSGSVTATWSGSAGPGVDSGGCSTDTVATDDHHALTVKAPAGLYDTVTTATTIVIKAANDLDLEVRDSAGSVVASSASGGGNEKVVITDLAAGSYDVVVCAGTVLSDSYKATLTSVASLRTTTTKVAKTLMTFTPATVVDPVLFGGEPGFTYDPTSAGGNARSFVDWPVSSRTMIGVLFRSEDGGLSYTKRYSSATDLAAAGVGCAARQVPYCPAGGGGDTDIDINPGSGSVGMGEQESLANQALGVSLDHGTTFPADHVDPALDKTGSGVDRQWQASWKGTKTRFMAYHVPAVGEFINRSDNDGALGSWTIPGVPQIPGVAQSGSMIADNTGGLNNRTLYVGYLGFPPVNAASGFNVGVSTDGAKSFVSHPIPGAANARNMTTLSLDKAGNLYAVWADSGTQHTYLATSLASDPTNRKAPATKWSKPVQVDVDPLKVTIFANTVAGSPGRVAIGYYGTAAKGPTPDDVKPGAGGWKPYIAYTSNALCQWSATPCESPTFSQDPIAHKINHDTNICTRGTTCAADLNANRNLLDYFAIDVDKAGHLGFVWSDTDNSTLMPYVKVARQASGPSLYAGMPDASLSMRGNGVADALGDAKYPIAGASILTAANQRALDLKSTTVQRASNGDVVVTVRVPGLSPSQNGVLPTSVDASGTPIQQARYVTRWDYHGQAYYAEMTLTGQEGGVSFGAGTVSAAEGQFNAGNVTATLGNTYQPLSPATGTFTSGKYVIRVPAGTVGSPKKGTELYSVGSYSLIGPSDLPYGSVQVLPLTVDSAPTFDTAFGVTTGAVTGSAPKADLPPAIPVKGGKGGLAATGLPVGVAALALLILATAAALRRRTH
jgi:hypothetical protein